MRELSEFSSAPSAIAQTEGPRILHQHFFAFLETDSAVGLVHDQANYPNKPSPSRIGVRNMTDHGSFRMIIIKIPIFS